MNGTGHSNSRARGPLAMALAGGASRRVFAPYLWRLARERCARSGEEYDGSASAMVNALLAARQLVEAEAIHLPIDAADVPAIDALRRLAATPRSFDLVALLPGPVGMAVARSIALDDAQEDAEDLARVVLEAGCDVLAVLEPRPDAGCSDCLRTVARLAAFYGARTLILAPPGGAFALACGFDAIDTGAAAPHPEGVPIAPVREGAPLPASRIVSSSWSVPAGGSDADWLRSSARQLRNDTTE